MAKGFHTGATMRLLVGRARHQFHAKLRWSEKHDEDSQCRDMGLACPEHPHTTRAVILRGTWRYQCCGRQVDPAHAAEIVQAQQQQSLAEAFDNMFHVKHADAEGTA